MPTVVMVVDGEEYYRKTFDSNPEALREANILKERHSAMFSNRNYELYIESPNQSIPGRSERRKIEIVQYSLDGRIVREFDSITSAAKSMGVVLSAIQRAVSEGRTSAGFKWKRK